MLEQLEQECSVEAAAITSHSSHFLVALKEHVEAVLELVSFVLFLQVIQIEELGDMRHTLVDFASDLLSVCSIGMVLRDSIINLFLLGLDFLLRHHTWLLSILLVGCCSIISAILLYHSTN